MLLLTSFALAIPPDLSSVVDEMIVHGNTAYGAMVIHDGAASARLRKARIEMEMGALAAQLTSGGCTVDTTVQEYLAGAYNQASGVIDGANSHGGAAATFGPGRTFSGSQAAAADFGVVFSNHTGGRYAASDRADGGFVVARWTRVKGKRGIFMGLQGVCDAGGSPAAAMEPVHGDLSGWKVDIELSIIDFGSGAPVVGALVTSGVGSTTTDGGGIAHVEQHLFGLYETVLEKPAYPDYHFFGINGGASSYLSDGVVFDDASVAGILTLLGIPVAAPPGTGIVAVNIRTLPDAPLAGVNVALDVGAGLALTQIGAFPGFDLGTVTDDSAGQSIVYFLDAPVGPVSPSVTPPPGMSCTVSPSDTATDITGEIYDGAFTLFAYTCI